MEGEYGVPTYKVEDVFNRFGYDYANWDKKMYGLTIKNNGASDGKRNSESGTVNKKTDKHMGIHVSIENAEFVNLYPMLNIAVLPEGIKAMLKGFVEGYTYYQLMCMVLFLKEVNMA